MEKIKDMKKKNQFLPLFSKRILNFFFFQRKLLDDDLGADLPQLRHSCLSNLTSTSCHFCLNEAFQNVRRVISTMVYFQDLIIT